MPQTNKKEEWVQHYKKQLKVFLPKNSGWYISNNGGNIKIEVKSGGRKETKTLPYAWNEQEMAVAIEEIKQIYKRYVEGSVHTLAAATAIASTSNSTNEPSWREIIESYREFVPFASNKTWLKSYYVEPKLVGNRKVLPVLNQVIRLMKSNKKPINGTELMIQALRQWEQGSRSRQISRRVLKGFLQWAVVQGKIENNFAPPATLPETKKPKRVGFAMSDLQIISLIESEKDEKWKFALQLLGTYGLRPVELKYLKIKEGIEGKELWSMYQKSKGGTKGEKTKPRRLEPLYLVNAEGKAMEYKLQTRVELGEALPTLGSNDGEAAMALRTRLRRNKLWNLYRIETKDVGEVLVPYSFRHRYAKQSHAAKFPLSNICKAMGHTQDVHFQNYSKFIPDGTSEMYDKVNKARL
ncbi:site-specific integrase [Prochlorococcus sp. AH-736-D21]|nr:site-specific integrase [Prochlorococcus sp. AH-736-D21]